MEHTGPPASALLLQTSPARPEINPDVALQQGRRVGLGVCEMSAGATHSPLEQLISCTS